MMLNNWVRNRWAALLMLLFLFTPLAAAYLGFIPLNLSQFLGLFVPASVGVLGSFSLYRKRQRDEQRRLRDALKAELKSMEFFYNWPDGFGSNVPEYDFVAKTVYERNANSLGLLSGKENQNIVEFYTRASIVQGIINKDWEKRLEAETSLHGTDTSKKTRRDGIRKQIDRLSLSRERALLTLEDELNESSDEHTSLEEIKESNMIYSSHPLVQRNALLCREYGILELVDDESQQFRVTSLGEDYFRGEFQTTDLAKTRDLLLRDQRWYEGLIDRLKRWLSGLLF